MIKSYKDLIVWQKSMVLVSEAYKLAALLPTSETYSLSSQIKRSAVSVPSNIAEGHSRNYTKEYLKHISIAQGSLAELETQILLIEPLGLGKADTSKFFELSSEVSKMLSSLRSKLSEY